MSRQEIRRTLDVRNVVLSTVEHSAVASRRERQELLPGRQSTIAMALIIGLGSSVSASQLFVDEMFGVTVTSNVIYGTSPDGNDVEKSRLLDIYEPTGTGLPAELPMIVLMHGGFFTGGDKTAATVATYATAFASRGYVAASIDYRLLFADEIPQPSGDPITPVPERFPSWLPNQLDVWGITAEDYFAEIAAAVADHAMAVNWLADNSGNYRGDPKRVAVGGYSAGAVSSLLLGAGAVDGVDADVGAVFSIAGVNGA